MFSGIIEECSLISGVKKKNKSYSIEIKKPANFNDLFVGHSISVNGVCLTVENFNKESIFFTIGFETIQVTGWAGDELFEQAVNLERALKVSDRLHGHWVTGHVDSIARVEKIVDEGDCKVIFIENKSSFKNYIWSKGSVTLNGVSLTVNEVRDNFFSVCVIPETLRKTNLKVIQKNMLLNIEFDYMAKAVHHMMSSSQAFNTKN